MAVPRREDPQHSREYAAALERSRKVAEALAARAVDVCRHYLPGGARSGAYWQAGDITGAAGRSLHVHLSGPRAGRWRDTETGDRGDLLDLIRRNGNHASFGPALREAWAFLGWRQEIPEPVPARGKSAAAGRGGAGTCPDAAECLRLLAEARARLIPLSPLGMALYENWMATPTKTDMVVEHHGNGGLVGCVPFSMEMVAVEIHWGGDAAEREVTSALGADPLAVDVCTLGWRRRGLWFPSNRREYKRKWETPSGGGEIHGDYSCAIVWDPAALWRAKRELDRTPDPHCVKIRKLFPTRAEKGRRRKAGKDAGPAWDQGRPVFGQDRG